MEGLEKSGYVVRFWLSEHEVGGIGLYKVCIGCQDSLSVRALDSRLKGCEFESWQEWWENFLLQCHLCVLTLSVSVPPLCYCSGT